MKARKKLTGRPLPVANSSSKFKSEYDPTCWIDDFLAALYNWQMQAREVGETITDEELYKKFRDSFVVLNCTAGWPFFAIER